MTSVMIRYSEQVAHISGMPVAYIRAALSLSLSLSRSLYRPCSQPLYLRKAEGDGVAEVAKHCIREDAVLAEARPLPA